MRQTRHLRVVPRAGELRLNKPFLLRRHTVALHRTGTPKSLRRGGGGRRSRPSSPQTSGGDTSGGFISHQKQRVKPRADPAATRGPDASSTRQYLFIYNHSQISSASRRRRLLRVQRGVNPVRPGQSSDPIFTHFPQLETL